MALIARHVDVLADQRKRCGVVIEGGVEPTRRIVAGLALLGESRLHVGRIIRGVEILGVAAVAIRRRSFELPVDVASSAIKRRVCARQSKAGEFQVIEFGAKPCIRAVAGFACGGKRRCLVVRRHCFLEVGRMAGKTRSRKSRELTGGFTLMAINALEHCVRAEKWEAVLVLLQLLRLNAPAFHRVASFAVGAEPPSMDIGVAISAAAAHIIEDQAGMTLRAFHFFVHAAQRIARAVVIKFRNTADGFPARVCMTVFAGDGDRAVRIAPRFLVSLSVSGNLRHKQQDEEPENEPSQCCRAHGTQIPFSFTELG